MGSFQSLWQTFLKCQWPKRLKLKNTDWKCLLSIFNLLVERVLCPPAARNGVRVRIAAGSYREFQCCRHNGHRGKLINASGHWKVLEGTAVKSCWMGSQRTQRCQVHYSCRKQQSGLQNEQKAALTAEPSNLVCWWQYPFCNLIPLQSHSKGKSNFPSPKRCRGDLPLRGLLGEEVAAPVKWLMEYECWSDRDYFH